MTDSDCPDDVQPVPVCIVENRAERIEAGTWGVWSGYVLLGTEPVFQILPQSEQRRRAVVIVTGAAPGVVYIAESMQKAQSKKGGVLPGGSNVTMESKSSMWIAPDGTNPMTVSVLLEGYRTE